MFDTEDWEWWNWLAFCGGNLLAALLGEYNRRRHERKREKFYGMQVAVDPTIELIDWCIRRSAIVFVRNLTAIFAFVFGCKWAYITIFGGG
jgi:hypothetical protein